MLREALKFHCNEPRTEFDASLKQDLLEVVLIFLKCSPSTFICAVPLHFSKTIGEHTRKRKIGFS